MKPVKLGFHGPRRATLNGVAQTIIAVCDDTHDSISLHALLKKEAIEEAFGPPRIRRHKGEARPEISIALDPARRYLELACDQLLSMLYIGVVDSKPPTTWQLRALGQLACPPRQVGRPRVRGL